MNFKGVIIVESLINPDILKKVKIPEKRIGLVASVQFLHKLDEAKKIIPNSVIVGQILGCNFTNTDKFENKVDAFLYIGSGPFHPIGLAYHTKKSVYVANPITNEFTKIKQEEVDKYMKEKKGKILSFLNAKKVGILVSVKPHQGNLKRALEFQEKLKRKKESFIFLCDNLDPSQFENFTDIEIWINTACPRIEHKKIINLQDALDLI